MLLQLKIYLNKKTRQGSLRLYPLCLMLVFILIFASACSTKHSSERLLNQRSMPNAAIIGEAGPSVEYNGKSVSTVRTKSLDANVLISDGDGNLAILESGEINKADPAYMDAREIKLKIRELGEQLIANSNDPYLQRALAMPVSFVRLDNINQTSSFGRLISEQLIYEFNQRGFPIREYRVDNKINSRESGEFYLKKAIGNVASTFPGALVVAGTYHADPRAIFVNARLIRPSDGRVLRTGNIILANNELTKRMLKSGGYDFKASGIPIRQARTSPKNSMPKDSAYSESAFGADIH